MLTAFDPYVAIDIDDKQENPASEAERVAHARILEQFDSYTERSIGARWTDAQGNERGGYHIIIKGSMPGSGRDHRHVGVYSSARFILLTGDVVRDVPIASAQELLDKLLAQMPAQATAVELAQVESDFSDATLHDMAMGATNGEKYARLCRGDVTYRKKGNPDGEYESQSEADLALLSMLAFYSPDNEQVRRVFRCTALGKREKATKDDHYLNRALRKIRAQQSAEQPSEEAIEASRALADVIPEPDLVDEATPVEALAYSLPPPPGLVGELYGYFHANARFPMQETAILASLGWFSAITGRAFNLGGTGLTLYMLLLAGTGRGKENMAQGIGVINDAIFKRQGPDILNTLGPRKFASGAGLVRTLERRPSILSIMGEFGLRLQELNSRTNQHASDLRACLLELYGKSGAAQMYSSTAHADQERNTRVIHSPNLVILGESTPGHVFDNLDFKDIEDGLLPRMLVLEYDGPAMYENFNAWPAPPDELVSALSRVFLASRPFCEGTLSPINPHPIVPQPDASDLLAQFSRQCTDMVNSNGDPYAAMLWSRAALNVKRVAGLLAVGDKDNWPESYTWLTRAHVEWAIAFVEHCVTSLLHRFQTGLVGTGAPRREGELKKYIKAYLRMSPGQRQHSYRVPIQIASNDAVVGYSYLSRRAQQCNAFKSERDFNMALNSTLDSMCRAGFLMKWDQQNVRGLGLKGDYYLLSPGASWD